MKWLSLSVSSSPSPPKHRMQRCNSPRKIEFFATYCSLEREELVNRKKEQTLTSTHIDPTSSGTKLTLSVQLECVARSVSSNQTKPWVKIFCGPPKQVCLFSCFSAHVPPPIIAWHDLMQASCILQRIQAPVTWARVKCVGHLSSRSLRCSYHRSLAHHTSARRSFPTSHTPLKKPLKKTKKTKPQGDTTAHTVLSVFTCFYHTDTMHGGGKKPSIYGVNKEMKLRAQQSSGGSWVCLDVP